jgi:hypothetical protein
LNFLAFEDYALLAVVERAHFIQFDDLEDPGVHPLTALFAAAGLEIDSRLLIELSFQLD